MKNTLLLTTFALLSAASAAAQGTVTTQPITPTSYPWSFTSPPVGLAYTETLQVNVANQSVVLGISPVGVCTLCGEFGIPNTSLPTAMTTTAPTTLPFTNSCTGTITFTSAGGTTIGKPVPFTVTLGQIFSAPLPFSMTGYSGFRGEVVASVQGTTTIPSTTLCSLSISLETFDTNTGITHVFLPLPASLTVPVAAYLSGNFSAISPSGSASVLK
jgi:hypothetical protein